MIAQPSSESPAKASPVGQVLAVTGAYLQLALVIGCSMMAVSMVRAVRVLGDEDQEEAGRAALSAVIGDALMVTAVGVVLALIGAALMLGAVFCCGYRSRWLFQLLVILGACYLLAFPVGTVVGLAFLASALVKRKEFLGVSPGSSGASVHLRA